MQLRTKVAVITGGSRGIGRAAAEVWSSNGAAVVLIARGQETLEATAKALRAGGAEVHHLAGDVSDEADVERIRAFLADIAGRVDILFNNAAIAPSKMPLHQLPPAEFDRAVAINLRGPYLMTRALVDLLAVRPGSQVLNATSGLKAGVDWGAYSITKCGIDAMTQVQAKELAPLGIRVNAFDPGWVKTDMAPDGPHDVESVKPRLLELALQGEDGPTGQEILAQSR